MISYDKNQFVSLADDLYLGGRKIEAIYMDYKQIYPSGGNAEWVEFYWDMPASIYADHIHATLKNIFYTEFGEVGGLNGDWYKFDKATKSWLKISKIHIPNLPNPTVRMDSIWWNDGTHSYITIKAYTAYEAGNIKYQFMTYMFNENETSLHKVNSMGEFVPNPFIINNNVYCIQWLETITQYKRRYGIYVLDKTSLTWNKICDDCGIIYFDRDYLWTDGNNIYLSEPPTAYGYDKDTHFILNPSTWKFEEKQWPGLQSEDFYAGDIFYFGDDVYCDFAYFDGYDAYHFPIRHPEWYILDKSSLTWRLSSTFKNPHSVSNYLHRDDCWIRNYELTAIKTVKKFENYITMILDTGAEDSYYRDSQDSYHHFEYNEDLKCLQPSDISGKMPVLTTIYGKLKFYGCNVWRDGANTYTFDSYGYNYILDIARKGWRHIDFGGFIPKYCDHIWKRNGRVYYSKGTIQKVFNSDEQQWVDVSWYTINSNNERVAFNPDGKYIWDDGGNIYYSNGRSQQYTISSSGNTWIKKTWEGFNPSGNYIWKDQGNIYYSSGNTQKVLEGSSWVDKTWNEFNPTKTYLWTDGRNIFYSKSTNMDYGNVEIDKRWTTRVHYVLERLTSTWRKITWTGTDYIDGRFVWHHGYNTYCSLGPKGQFYLIKGDVNNG